MRPDMPPGHVRAFDVRSGTPRWTFHSIPSVANGATTRGRADPRTRSAG
jgi:hypothetical protein